MATGLVTSINDLCHTVTPSCNRMYFVTFSWDNEGRNSPVGWILTMVLFLTLPQIDFVTFGKSLSFSVLQFSIYKKGNNSTYLFHRGLERINMLKTVRQLLWSGPYKYLSYIRKTGLGDLMACNLSTLGCDSITAHKLFKVGQVSGDLWGALGRGVFSVTRRYSSLNQ